MNDITFDDILITAKTIYGEARGKKEGHMGRLAVGWVIRNRWESGKWFGRGTISDVCLRPFQFSCWNKTDPNREKLESLSLDNEVLHGCFYAAIGALRGMEPDPTYQATHYHVAEMKRLPAWADPEKRTVRLYSHQFYAGIN